MIDDTRLENLLRKGDAWPVPAPDLREIRRRGRRQRTVRRTGYAGAVAALAVAVAVPLALQGPGQGGGDEPQAASDPRLGSVIGTDDSPPASDPRFRIEYGSADPLDPDDPGAEYVLDPSAAPDLDAALGTVVDLGFGLYGPGEPDRGRLWAQQSEMVSGDHRTYVFLGDRDGGRYYAHEDPHRRNIAESGPWGSLNVRWFFVPTKSYVRDPVWLRDAPFTALFAVYRGDGVDRARWVREDGSSLSLELVTDVVPGATVVWGRTGAGDTNTTGAIELYDRAGDLIAECDLAQCGVPWMDQSYGGPLPPPTRK